jgi:hypothetical protein
MRPTQPPAYSVGFDVAVDLVSAYSVRRRLPDGTYEVMVDQTTLLPMVFTDRDMAEAIVARLLAG